MRTRGNIRLQVHKNLQARDDTGREVEASATYGASYLSSMEVLTVGRSYAIVGVEEKEELVG